MYAAEYPFPLDTGRLEDVLEAIWTCYVILIYVLCPGGFFCCFEQVFAQWVKGLGKVKIGSNPLDTRRKLIVQKTLRRLLKRLFLTVYTRSSYVLCFEGKSRAKYSEIVKINSNDVIQSDNFEQAWEVMHNVEKWSNVHSKSCGVPITRFLKYLWPFLNIMHIIVNVAFALLSLDMFLPVAESSHIKHMKFSLTIFV